MNTHLSPEDISHWLAGERSSEVERHTGECEQCSARLDDMENRLAEFRRTTHDWSAAHPVAAPRIDWGQSVRRTAQRWVLAAASLVILISGSAYWEHARQRARVAEMAREDAILKQVDAEISRAVPQPMEPLVSLVTWGPGPKDGSKN
jgi:aryl-alcohol dehydrogenase-like predicted oxidoreductase